MKQNLPPYDPAKIEKKWQNEWEKKKLYASKDSAAKGKYYVLDMFPYPSGEGLHVGHPKGYIATDVVSRMKRMQGMNVLHPMGFDAFGLPAENYAIKTKTNPADSVAKNVLRFKKQLEIIGLDYDWSREVNTTDPDYYKWTQWIFLQLYKKGLAYESNEPINWCPSCKTGLANEDVEDGRCERCGTPVEKKPLRQWVLRITDYADRLLKDLDAKILANGDLFGHNGHGEPYIYQLNEVAPGKVRPDMPFVERNAIVAFIEHWENGKILMLKWKKVDWVTGLTGGIENGQTAEETARREILEETGYKNVELVRMAGRKLHSTFFHLPKNENRVGHFTCLYLKLKNGERAEISEEEQLNHEIIWVDRSEVFDMLNASAQKIAWSMLTDTAYFPGAKPLLDWPESIKELQRNWIGRSEGAEIDFELKLNGPKTRFILIHGYEGGPNDDFFPWLKNELESRGHEVQVPALPNPNDPKEHEQVDFVRKNCTFDEHTVVFGHSLGAVVALKAVMKSGVRVGGIVLAAAACDPDMRGDRGDMPFDSTFSWDYDYGKIRELAGGRIAVVSDTREKERVAYMRHLADELGAKLVETKSVKEHFTSKEEPAMLRSLTPSFTVFTTRPDTIFGVTYAVLAPEHDWVREFLPQLQNKAEVEAYIERAAGETAIARTDATKEKTGVELKGVKAVNPATGKEVPIWIADYVLADYGTGAVMAVPAHDERDFAFAKKFKLPIREVVSGGDISTEAFIGSGTLVNSGSFSGKSNESVMKDITAFAGGRWVTKYKLRDWVFSRQRYWGEPIPLIHCEKCGVVPVPEKDLPVKLPKVESYEPTGTGESPLAAIEKWVNVTCPQCGEKGKRETNTMPQWAGSCWYYLRYEDPTNDTKLVDPKKERYWSPVDLYVGGAEHATRHLIYARFWHKFLYDIGVVSYPEPFTKLQSVGLIMGEDGRKMSKRFGNVVNPDDIVARYGADTLRVYEMFMGPFDQQISWSTSSMVGARRFIERVWKLSDKTEQKGHVKSSAVREKMIHKTIRKVTEDICALRFNTAISSLMIAVNELERQPSVSRGGYEAILKLLAPFAPHVADELWEAIGNTGSIHISTWPTFDPAMTVDAEVRIIVQVNGKVRASFIADSNATAAELERMALSEPLAKKWMGGAAAKKVIVVPGRVVNIVT